MVRAHLRSFTVVVVGAALLGAALAAADETGTEPSEPAKPVHRGERVRWIGKVKSVSEDGRSFVLQVKAGAFAVSLSEAAEVTDTTREVLKNVPSGTTLHVLGRAQDGSWEVANIRNIQAIVAAPPEWAPPPVTVEQRRERLDWLVGTIQHRFEGPPLLGYHQLQIDRNRVIPVLEKTTSLAIAKGKLVFVDGRRAEDPRKKEATATRVSVLAPGIPTGEYALLFGL